MQNFWAAITETLETGQPATLSTVVDGPQAGAAGLYKREGELIAGIDVGWSENPDAGTLFVDTIYPRPALVIFGGGHVAIPVAKIGSLIGFEVIVNDDRPEFANPQRFPEASRVLAMSHEQTFRELKINSRHYVVIVTRGHIHDRDCLVQALKTEAAYIGVIGSTKKAAEINQWLLEHGFSQGDLKRVFSPIGLPINAQTPEEIAVSIMAEVVRERSRRPISANLAEIAQAVQKKPRGETWALVTIVHCFGSTPRGKGARMLVKADGSSIGTVGGGPGEKEAETIALEVIQSGIPRQAEFHLDNKLAAEAGAVCGGNMTMFIQPV